MKKTNKTKRAAMIFTAVILIFTLCTLSVFSAFASAAESGEKSDMTSSTKEVNVYVTVAAGELKLAMEKIAVTDADKDGVLTINDALICAHDAKFDGGAAAGYGSVISEYGISMTKLWGIENGGAYGYYLNDSSAVSLAAPVADKDRINAFAYSDTAAYSDVYTFFEIAESNDDTIKMTLKSIGFDADWNPVTAPVADAEITLNGKSTGISTDADGNASVKTSLLDEGSNVISAVCQKMTIVPPAYVISKVENKDSSGCGSAAVPAAVIAICAIFALSIRRKPDEN